MTSPLLPQIAAAVHTEAIIRLRDTAALRTCEIQFVRHPLAFGRRISLCCLLMHLFLHGRHLSVIVSPHTQISAASHTERIRGIDYAAACFTRFRASGRGICTTSMHRSHKLIDAFATSAAEKVTRAESALAVRALVGLTSYCSLSSLALYLRYLSINSQTLAIELSNLSIEILETQDKRCIVLRLLIERCTKLSRQARAFLIDFLHPGLELH